MPNKLPIIAAIPHYNMASSAIDLVRQTLDQGYDATYVLDDGSEPEHVENLIDTIGLDATIVRGETNAGAGANRNRILGSLSSNAYIHFIDADTTLETPDSAARVREMMDRPQLSFVGGLVRDADGEQMVWNFGPRMAAFNDMRGMSYLALEGLKQQHPNQAAAGRRALHKLLKPYPNPSTEPHERTTFWVSEANMAIEADTFRILGGFDEKLREHEIQDLAIRARQRGLVSRFNPAVSVTHHALDVRHYNRNLAMLRAEAYIVRKHGLKNWLIPPSA